MKQMVAAVEQPAATRPGRPMRRRRGHGQRTVAPHDVAGNQQAAEQAAPEQHGPDIGLDQAGEEPGGAEGERRRQHQHGALPAGRPARADPRRNPPRCSWQDTSGGLLTALCQEHAPRRPPVRRHPSPPHRQEAGDGGDACRGARGHGAHDLSRRGDPAGAPRADRGRARPGLCAAQGLRPAAADVHHRRDRGDRGRRPHGAARAQLRTATRGGAGARQGDGRPAGKPARPCRRRAGLCVARRCGRSPRSTWRRCAPPSATGASCASPMSTRRAIARGARSGRSPWPITWMSAWSAPGASSGRTCATSGSSASPAHACWPRASRITTAGCSPNGWPSPRSARSRV